MRGVRLFHASVRRLILNDPAMHWDADELGMPVNQEDLLGTLIVFSLVVIDALEKFGVDVRSEKGKAAARRVRPFLARGRLPHGDRLRRGSGTLT